MKMLARAFLGLLAALVLVAGLLVGTARPASAGTQPTLIVNITGANINVACKYNGKLKGPIVENSKWGIHHSTFYCPIDVDEWSQPHTRCMYLVSPQYKVGYYKVKSGRFKMPGASIAKFHAWSKCSGKKVIRTWTLK